MYRCDVKGTIQGRASLTARSVRQTTGGTTFIFEFILIDRGPRRRKCDKGRHFCKHDTSSVCSVAACARAGFVCAGDVALSILHLTLHTALHSSPHALTLPRIDRTLFVTSMRAVVSGSVGGVVWHEAVLSRFGGSLASSRHTDAPMALLVERGLMYGVHWCVILASNKHGGAHEALGHRAQDVAQRD